VCLSPRCGVGGMDAPRSSANVCKGMEAVYLRLAGLVAMSRHLSCSDGGLCVALRWETGVGRGFRDMDRNEIHDSTEFLWNVDGGVIPTLDGVLGYNREVEDGRLRLLVSRERHDAPRTAC